MDFSISTGWLIIIGLVLVFIILWIRNEVSEKNKLLREKKEGEEIAKRKEAELKVYYQQWAFDEFSKFRETEIKGIENNAIKSASVLLQRWKVENESAIRVDAINRSYSVNLGKITEHLLPYHINFPFNPKDARFIGSPIDLIVFDGHSEKKEEIMIYIVEIKSGNSRLTDIQKKVKSAVLKGNIRWSEINPADTNLKEQAI